MADWKSFAVAGDLWLISYAVPPDLVGVKLFTIGHAAELYLKAVYTKQTGNAKQAIEFGHNLKKLWDKCKSNDNNFMSQYQMQDPYYDLGSADWLI